MASNVNPANTIAGFTYFPRQWQAVAAPVHPILVLACPGAGKTRCLTGRIAYLIQELKADPTRICAITFTNKAANEIVARVRLGIEKDAENLTLGTIHSICLKILRPHAERVGLPNGFGVADEQHQTQVLRKLKIWQKKQIDSLKQSFSIRRINGQQLLPKEEQLFQNYIGHLRSSRLIDYDDILWLTRRLLEEHPEVLLETQGRWDHLLVDEFQDLDHTQYTIIKLIASSHRSLFGVGDDKQSIFAFRGANPQIIAYFQKDFGVDLVQLNTNCRCSKVIFEIAQRILHRTNTYHRFQIETTRPTTHDVEVSQHENEHAEAHWVVKHLLADREASGLDLGEYAVLYRKHSIGESLETAFLEEGLPCQMGKGKAFADDPVIEQLVSSLRLALDPESELELERYGKCVLGETLFTQVEAVNKGTFLEKLRQRAERKDGADAKTCWRLIYQIGNIRSVRQTATDLAGLVDTLLALGINKHSSPLDEIAARLIDPADIPPVVALGTALDKAVSGLQRVLLAPADGLEILVRRMLLKVMPRLRVEYLLPATVRRPDDLIVKLSPEGIDSAGNELLDFAWGDLPVTLAVFTTLQFVEGLRYRKAFTDYVTFDIESTDLDINACQAVELAAVRVRNGVPEATFETLIRCTRSVSAKATEIHGYTDLHLTNQPTLQEVWPRFQEFIGNDILVAHNGFKFDVPVLQRLVAPWSGLRGTSFFDTLPLSKDVIRDGGHRLEDLAHRYGVATGRSHHALDDAECLAQVFEHLQDERIRLERKTCLTNLLDAVAVGLAVEESPITGEFAELAFRKGSRKALGRHSDVLDYYAMEAEGRSILCPPVAELIEQLGGQELRDRCQKERKPEDRFPEVHGRLHQLIATAKAGSLDESIRNLLDQIALSRSDGSETDPHRISLLTFHATKGLEFSRVYVVGVEDNQLPGYRDLKDNNEASIEESRRLLYVAMTRAKDRLVMTHCGTRDGKPSGGTMFLQEMGLVEVAEAVAVSH